MVTGIALLSVLLQSSPTAVVAYNDKDRQYVKFTSAGRVHKLLESQTYDRGGRMISGIGPAGFAFKGHRYQVNKDSIVRKDNGATVTFRSEPIKNIDTQPMFRCITAMDLGDRMLWIFGWISTEVSLEPAAKVEAYEVVDQGGKLKILRQTELSGATGYSSHFFVSRMGQSLLLNNAQGKTSILDLKSWREQSFVPSGSVISDAGQVYWWNKGVFQSWNKNLNDWKPIRRIDCGELTGLTNVGDDTLVHGSKSSFLLKRGTELKLPAGYEDVKSHSTQLYLKPKVGLALMHYTNERQWKGYVFDAKTLKPITPISNVKP